MSLNPEATNNKISVRNANNLGRYQRGWSKVKMKVTKYKPSVDTQSLGSGATSWLI